MNYELHYNNLIEKSKDRITPDIFENHHIIPKCMNGNDDLSNIAILTPEEHFVAHQLLVKMYPGDRKLIYALSKMCSDGPKTHRSNKRYGWIRRQWIIAFSGINNPRSKLIEQQVVEIYHSIESNNVLSERYCIGKYQIISIKRKLTYKSITKDINELPGFYTSGKTTRLPIPIDFIEKIFYDTGDYEYFWEKYKATERVVKSIKDKRCFKKITGKLGIPGQVKRYGMTRDMIEVIFNAAGTNKEIAAQFDIHYNTVRNIKGKNSRAWHMWEEY